MTRIRGEIAEAAAECEADCDHYRKSLEFWGGAVDARRRRLSYETALLWKELQTITDKVARVSPLLMIISASNRS